MNFVSRLSFCLSVIGFVCLSNSSQAGFGDLEEIENEDAQLELSEQWKAAQATSLISESEMKKRLATNSWQWVRFEPIYKPVRRHGKVFAKKVQLHAIFQELQNSGSLAETAVVPVRSCKRFNRQYQKGLASTHYGFGKYQIDLRPGVFSYHGKEIYNTVLEACEAQLSTDTTFMCPNTVEKTKLVVSKVGALVTLASQEHGGARCGAPFSDMSVETLNLRTGRNIELTDYLEESSLVTALKNAAIFESSHNPVVADPKKLADLNFAGSLLGGFSIDELNLQEEKVRIRLALMEPLCENCSEDFIWIGLDVKPTKKFLDEYKFLQIDKEFYAQERM